MANILFVTETYIRANTVFNQNLDVKDIVQNIDPAQDMFVQPILGSTYYDYLLNAYSAQTLTADETTLVLHIKPMLAYRAAEMALPFIAYQLKNKGPQTQSGDFSAPVDQTVIHYLRNELKNRAEFYDQRLRRYLLLNQNLFSGYTTQNLNEDMVPDKSFEGYDSGFAQYPGYGYGNGCNNCGGGFNGFWNTNIY